LNIWGFLNSGQIFEIYADLLYFQFKNTIISSAYCAESAASALYG